MGETSPRFRDSLDELRQICRTYPVIDNHGHNLLRPHGQKNGDLLTITSEAEGDALGDVPTSLAHLRAARLLRRFYGLPLDAEWSAIEKKRKEALEQDADGLIKRCFEGTETVLFDDGLAHGDAVEPYYWHDKFTNSPCKRIVRIETLASEVLSSLYQQNKLPTGAEISDREGVVIAWVTFVAAFEHAIAAALEDEEVVGFKSVVCYRTGLDVKIGRDVDVTEDGLKSFRRHFLPDCVANKFRVDAKGMNDAIVISTCKLIAASNRQRDIAKPLQFHTGLGDNDISLLHSNPGCLQPLIKEYPTVPIVLLHSSYPYTREAGYLASVYKNCYLDLGEVFPMISRDGQERVLGQAFELTPWSKLLWSTDGHYFPETFWLANVQGRRAMERLMCEYVEEGDLTEQQAARAVKDIFFENSNRLYSLRLRGEETSRSLPMSPRKKSQSDRSGTTQRSADGAIDKSTTQQADRPSALQPEQNAVVNAEPSQSDGAAALSPGPTDPTQAEESRDSKFTPNVISPLSNETQRGIDETRRSVALVAGKSGVSETRLDDEAAQRHDPLELIAARHYPTFLDEPHSTRYVFVQWVDYLGQMRTRCVPIIEFTKIAKLGERVRISYGNLGTLQNDHFSPVCNPVGAIYLDLDYATLRPMQDVGRMKDTATIMAGFLGEDMKPLELCPRQSLTNVVNSFTDEYGVEFLVGFEIEVTFCKRDLTNQDDPYEPLDTMHAWGTFSDEQYMTAMPLMTEITAALMSLGIGVQQMHSEAGAGQYEFVLPPLPPVHAVDTLYQSRQCITQIAAIHGLRATCYPTPFEGVGSASHAHISFNSTTPAAEGLEKIQKPFIASLLDHLTSLCAFTMPQTASYGRVIDDSWTGGTFIAWGTQNREVPIRKSAENRWEIRCMDGCANMYLALAAIFAAGLHGVRSGTEMKISDVLSNPSRLSDEEKHQLGITRKMPASLEEAIKSAKEDFELEQAMSSGMLQHYLAMKDAEQAMLGEWPEQKRRMWLMEKY